MPSFDKSLGAKLFEGWCSKTIRRTLVNATIIQKRVGMIFEPVFRIEQTALTFRSKDLHYVIWISQKHGKFVFSSWLIAIDGRTMPTASFDVSSVCRIWNVQLFQFTSCSAAHAMAIRTNHIIGPPCWVRIVFRWFHLKPKPINFTSSFNEYVHERRLCLSSQKQHLCHKPRQ